MLDTGKLDQIQTLPKLLEYLRDSCDWPIDDIEIDDLVFDWDPKVLLGLNDADAFRHLEIKQLRPLTTNQPWGIFFINFPKKDMPVTVLRRLLGALTVRKRKSAQKAEQAAWQKHDLLFISAYGDSGHRQLTFAHFQDDDANGDLPRLRVLGWDGDNTIRRLSSVNTTLRDKLHWPLDTQDLNSWREQWSGAFVERLFESIRTAKQLASALAILAKGIRVRANRLLAVESETGPLRRLHAAFKEALVHDLEPDGFADMYAQTIAYGLLSARISRASGALTADDAALMAPATNPFLQELMQTFLKAGGRRGGMDFDELGVNDIVETLRRAEMDAVLRDFDDRNPEEDPVIYFYQSFLTEYDPKERIQRGVFYTPRPVVSFIVRSVDEVLRRDFGLEDGLADTATWGDMESRLPGLKRPAGTSVDEPFVRILDPATGTGTFLVEAVDLIHRRMAEKWTRTGKSKGEIEKLWNDYVPRHLLTRLYGFELMMAPYAIAHMKLGLKLYDTGYRFGSKARARIFLTNSLEGAKDFDFQLAFMSEALAHEAKTANDTKRRTRFTVVLGNPPYSGISSNMNPWINGLLKGLLPSGLRTKSYYEIDGSPLGEKKVWLQDDYVKFIRLGQWNLDTTGVGVLGYISNHGYLDNPTFRGMRAALLDSFERMLVIDLHGNSKKKERAPDGQDDENVFDITQGVAIGIMVHPPTGCEAEIFRADIWGSRARKYEMLTAASVNSRFDRRDRLSPSSPFYFFEKRETAADDVYPSSPSLPEIFPVNASGIVTARDDFVVDFDESALLARISDLRDQSLSTSALRARYFGGKSEKKYPAGDSRGWKLPEARKKARNDKAWRQHVRSILYRPFDERLIYYADWVVDWPRLEVMRHMLAGCNFAILSTRSLEIKRGWEHVFCSNCIVQHHTVSIKEVNYAFPLWLKSDGTEIRTLPNVSGNVVSRIEAIAALNWDNRLGSDRDPDRGRGDLQKTFGPRDLFDWIYTVLHSPSYRTRYADLLKSDFARIPLPGSRALFQALVPLGAALVALHLLDHHQVKFLRDPKNVRFAGRGPALVEKGQSKWINGRVTINTERWFEEVPESVWSFHIGGYQVCEKWLKDRRDRMLTGADILHYRRIVVALSETIRLMAEVDRIIDAHGGWPAAFKGMAD